MLRIGFDVDGVLANFVEAYQRLVVQLTGRDVFQPGDDMNPPCWDWPQFRGYTNEEVSQVWASIKANPTFWMNLLPLDGVGTLRLLIPELERKHEIYYVTSRVGQRPKRQSEVWLWEALGYHRISSVWPTVIISSNKGDVARALRLDAYIDDNRDNALDVGMESPTTQNYLLDRHYNRAPDQNDAGAPYRRILTVGQMLDAELTNLVP